MNKIFSIFMSNDKHERQKIGWLAFAFLMVIGAYTVIYDLKHSMFITIVGKEYVPYAKIMSMFILVPAVLFYSFLVDRLRRYQLLYFYSFIYFLFGLASIYFIGHPTIGIANTVSNPYRLFGWFFYFFVEGFSPFVVSVFWAFSNSVNSPKSAKENYGVLVAGSKMGGLLSAGFAWFLLTLKDAFGQPLFSDIINHQLLLLFFTILVLLIPLIIFNLIRRVPAQYLHGYEAVYQFEKKHAEEENPGLLSGLKMILSRPYILGIFGMLFFYEILNTILSYQRLAVVQAASSTVSDISTILYQQMFAMHTIGLFISLFGTGTLLRLFGERLCLLLIPLVSGILLLYFWFSPTALSLSIVFITLKSLNYGFASPIRESLYIPTIKDIKFKSKSWIDAFGQKMARSLGSSVNAFADMLDPVLYATLHGIVFISIIASWGVTAFLLGKRYTKAIERNEVIS